MTLIMIYGLWKSKGQTGTDSYLLAGRQMPWYMVLLGIMATQASAITFISGPGQAYSDGMRFVQYYFGLPIAMIVVAAVFVPIFKKINAYTAYEYLDKRFDRKTRLLTGVLFLFSRGIATGFSVFAPAIVVSSIFGWNIFLTNILVGGLLIIYTFTGGAKAVAHTQKIQFGIILAAMALAGYMVVGLLPEHITFGDSLYLVGKAGKLNVITTDFKWDDKYNIFSGIIGGFFLALSYFGTDQSQVGRYLTAKDTNNSKLGLLLNGFVKIPMQFLILLIGALLFSFYTINKAPLFFNEAAANKVQQHFPEQYNNLFIANKNSNAAQQNVALQLIDAKNHQLKDREIALLQQYQTLQQEINKQRKEISTIIDDNPLTIGASKDDTNYIFLHFVKNYLPAGMVGLVFAIVFLASWGSISAALNALASSSLLDFHQLIFRKEMSNKQEVRWAKFYTLFWGMFGIGVAMLATKMKSLIEAVNELGSLFYGPILGVFLVAFFFKKIKGNAVFIAILLAELTVFIFYQTKLVAFLWLNVIGAACVVLLALFAQFIFQKTNTNETQA